jgi:hypothetical protein
MQNAEMNLHAERGIDATNFPAHTGRKAKKLSEKVRLDCKCPTLFAKKDECRTNIITERFLLIENNF